MFLAIAFAVVVLLLIVSLTGGLQMAMRFCLPIALLGPTWTYFELGAAHIDIRAVALGFLIFAYLLKYGVSTRISFNWADLLVTLLLLSELTSLYLSKNFSPTSVPEVMLKWVGPYLFARLLILSNEDIRELVPYLLGSLLALVTLAGIECVTKTNPIHSILGHSGSLASTHGFRWDLRRAEGPMKHPIFFGMALMLLFPWALEARRLATERLGQNWWKIAPLVGALGPFFTMSRGPILGVLITLACIIFLRKPTLRLPMAILSLFCTGMLFFGIGNTIELLEATAEDTKGFPIEINGEEYTYTGTNHRLLQLKVYEKVLADAGWFGFGKFLMTIPEHA